MILKTSQIKIVEEKLRIYNKPFIEFHMLKKIIDKYAPNYEIKAISAHWQISPIKNWKLYLNNLYKWYISRYAIIWKYMQDKAYMIWWLYIYNKYWFSTQLANWITVYNTIYSWQKTIAWANFIFHKVRPSFIWGKQRKQSQDVYYYVMTPERALIQLLQETNWKPEFAEDIYSLINKWEINKNKTISLSKSHCSKRIQNLINNFFNA